MRTLFHSAHHVPAIVAACAALLTCGCTILELDQTPCPKGGTTLTYANFGALFFEKNCNICHSAADGQRQGAPDAYIFGTLAEIQANKERIFRDSAGTNDSMPPGPDDPPLEDREHLLEWMACGMPP